MPPFWVSGVCYNKFTGSRGKSGSNDANAEFIGRLRKIMDDNHVYWQTAELGKVDVGGGGTIAYICALYGMEVIDSGVPVLSMHAPRGNHQQGRPVRGGQGLLPRSCVRLPGDKFKSICNRFSSERRFFNTKLRN